jgi:hypothetical protein
VNRSSDSRGGTPGHDDLVSLLLFLKQTATALIPKFMCLVLSLNRMLGWPGEGAGAWGTC